MILITKILAVDSTPVTAGSTTNTTNPTTFGTILSKINPFGTLQGEGGITGFLNNVVTIALDFAGMLAVIMILYGSFLYVTAYGDDTKAATAKKTIFWSIAGLVVLALAHAFVDIMNGYIYTVK